MTFWAIVPVKPLRRGKSRLAGVLSPDDRAALNASLLAHTLDTLRKVPEIAHTLVVSRDPEALSLARNHGARTITEHGAPHLNIALARATAVVRSFHTQGLLILPADLPLLNVQDIQKMLGLAQRPPVVVIAPDRHRQGTNGMVIFPAGMFQYSFGVGSFWRHCERAERAGARVEICEITSLGLDVDLPEDLNLVSEELDGLTLPYGEVSNA
jgi:2-phospho-L-lactate guanylyltransferase